jgi:hypothetical protein
MLTLALFSLPVQGEATRSIKPSSLCRITCADPARKWIVQVAPPTTPFPIRRATFALQIVQNMQNKKYIEQVFFCLYRATKMFSVRFYPRGRSKFTCGHR